MSEFFNSHAIYQQLRFRKEVLAEINCGISPGVGIIKVGLFRANYFLDNHSLGEHSGVQLSLHLTQNLPAQADSD